MSQQENPQDSQENSSAPQADAWTTPPASNRPAEGATRVASLHNAEQTWTASEGATDFLGLEQDSALAAPASEQASPESGAPEVNPTQAWLFHMESGATAAVEPQVGRAARPALAAPEWSAEALPADEIALPLASETRDAEEKLAAGDVLPVEPAGELQLAEADPRSRRKVQWLVAASLVATLLAAGGWQVWYGRSKTQTINTSDPIVWRSTGKKPPNPKPTPKGEKLPSATPTVAQTPPVEQAPEPTHTAPLVPVETTPTEVAQTTPPVEEPTPVAVESQPTAAVTTPAPEQPLAVETAQPDAPPVVDFTPVAFSGTRPDEPANALVAPKGTRRPDAGEIAGLWTSNSIPFDAIGADSMLRTPSVGAVRVLLKNGEHLQGRLHSVGQGQVSMDIALGRMSVDYSDVSEMVQILDAALTAKPSNGLPEETAGLLYVSAKVPGGYLTGWLVQRTAGKLTLITEQAKKITFEDDGFEPVSKGKARVVGTLGRSTAEDLSPAPVPSNAIPKLQGGTPATKPPAKANPGKPGAKKPRG